MIKQNVRAANSEETGLTNRQIHRDFWQVKLGMSQEDVGKIIGIPDETRQVAFGGQTLTGWVYRTEAKPIQIWFDECGKLRLKN
jgi:hypothetical protein